MQVVFWLPVLLLAFACMILGLFVPRFVLGCVFEAERKRGLPTQFHTPDLMWLTLLVQIGLATVPTLTASDKHGLIAMCLYGVVLLVVPTVWWSCLRVLSRAGVLGFWKRGLFLVLVVPMTLVLTLTGGLAGAALPIVIYESFLESRPSEAIAYAVAAVAATIAGVYSLRLTARYCIENSLEDMGDPEIYR